MSIVRNSSYNLIGSVIPLAVSLVMIPLYVKVIGLDRYGLLSLSLLLVGYFRLFDLGIGRAAAQKIGTLSNASPEKRSRIFWSGAAISAGLAILAFALFLPIAQPVLGLIDMPSGGLRAETADALPLLSAAVPFALAQSLLVGTLEGRSEFLKINVINSLGTIATAVLPVATASLISVRMDHLIAAVLVSRLLVLLLLIRACVQAVPLGRPILAPRKEVAGLLRFGGWTTITSIIGPLLVILDRFAIGAVLGSAAVALYAVPYSVVIQIVLLPAAVCSALFPRLAASSNEDAKQLSEEAMRTIAFLVTPITVAFAIVAEPFFNLWIGAANARESTPVALLLLLGVWANSLARIPFVRLQAQGRPDLIAIAHFAEAFPYFGILYLALLHFGIAGAAFAWSFRCAGDFLILCMMVKTKLRLLTALLAYGGVLAAVIAVALATPPDSTFRWVCLACFAFFTALAMRWNAPARIVERLGGLIRVGRSEPGMLR